MLGYAALGREEWGQYSACWSDIRRLGNQMDLRIKFDRTGPNGHFEKVSMTEKEIYT